ncbi:hypothetical protein O9Y75_29025, partial [Klebsiella pneumoniae]
MALLSGGVPDLHLYPADPAFASEHAYKSVLGCRFQIQAQIKICEAAPEDLLARKAKVVQELVIRIQNDMVAET